MTDNGIGRDGSHGPLENRMVAAVFAIQQSGPDAEMRNLLERLEACHLGDRAFDETTAYEFYREAQALLAKVDASLASSH